MNHTFGKLLICDSRADLIFQFDTRKRELLKSWPAHGDGAGDLALDRVRHRLFVGTRIPAEMTVYDSLSGKEIVSLPGPETMDGVYYDADLKRIYMSGGPNSSVCTWHPKRSTIRTPPYSCSSLCHEC